MMFGEDLLRRLSESPDVKERGRSEVVREAVEAFLKQREKEQIAERYRRAYSDTSGLEVDLADWAAEGQWLDE